MQVLRFNAQGQFLAVVAKPGNGPDEYQFLSGWQFFPDGSAFGFDAFGGSVKRKNYDASLKLIDAVVFNPDDQGFLREALYSDDRQWAAVNTFKVDAEQGLMFMLTSLRDGDLKVVKPLSEVKWTRIFNPAEAQNPAFWVDYLADQFTALLNQGSHFARFTRDGHILIVHGKNYEIEVHTPDFKTKRHTIQKEFEAVPFHDEDRQALVEWIEETVFKQAPQLSAIVTPAIIAEAMNKADLPARKNPVALFGVLPVDQNAFFVIHDHDLKTGAVRGDVLTVEGAHVSSFALPGSGCVDFFGPRIHFQNNRLYCMERNEDGENVMAVYRIERKDN
jgi:hypothetical protein